MKAKGCDRVDKEEKQVSGQYQIMKIIGEGTKTSSLVRDACKHQKKQIGVGGILSGRDVTKRLPKVKTHANNKTSERFWV